MKVSHKNYDVMYCAPQSDQTQQTVIDPVFPKQSPIKATIPQQHRYTPKHRVITKCRPKIQFQRGKPGAGHTAARTGNIRKIPKRTTSPLPNRQQQNTTKESQHQQAEQERPGRISLHSYPPVGDYSTMICVLQPFTVPSATISIKCIFLIDTNLPN